MLSKDAESEGCESSILSRESVRFAAMCTQKEEKMSEANATSTVLCEVQSVTTLRTRTRSLTAWIINGPSQLLILVSVSQAKLDEASVAMVARCQ